MTHTKLKSALLGKVVLVLLAGNSSLGALTASATPIERPGRCTPLNQTISFTSRGVEIADRIRIGQAADEGPFPAITIGRHSFQVSREGRRDGNLNLVKILEDGTVIRLIASRTSCPNGETQPCLYDIQGAVKLSDAAVAALGRDYPTSSRSAPSALTSPNTVVDQAVSAQPSSPLCVSDIVLTTSLAGTSSGQGEESRPRLEIGNLYLYLNRTQTTVMFQINREASLRHEKGSFAGETASSEGNSPGAGSTVHRAL